MTDDGVQVLFNILYLYLIDFAVVIGDQPLRNDVVAPAFVVSVLFFDGEADWKYIVSHAQSHHYGRNAQVVCGNFGCDVYSQLGDHMD